MTDHETHRGWTLTRRAGRTLAVSPDREHIKMFNSPDKARAYIDQEEGSDE